MGGPVMRRLVLASAALIAGGLTQAQTPSKERDVQVNPAIVEDYIKRTFKNLTAGWEGRVVQDETQRLCSQYHNNPPLDVFNAILAREKATVVFPSDGTVIGDWRQGEKVSQDGRGGQFSDRPNIVNGGNCYACHQMAKSEVSFGTLGPSLSEYGKIRKFSPEEAKAVYAKIFNSQSVRPCSSMPRFGYHKFLTELQMKDVTAYLMSPESPVNK
jgi:sulfur-oxidizing protein SoxX